MRARDIAVTVGDLPPGSFNAITDVDGVRVGHATIVRGDGPLVVGSGPVRTGVTVVVPPDGLLFAGCHRLNGNGELTGLEWVRESGRLTTPIGLTNTHSVGVVRDGLIRAAVEAGRSTGWSLPVVGETYDGGLNDVDGMHVTYEHVREALAGAAAGAVGEGAVGGGTGMVCHGFKGGIGTSSRVTPDGWTVGVLVQANHGRRARLRVNGVAVGERIGPDDVPTPRRAAVAEGAGSIIGIVATDAPLLPTQCARLAQRAALGVARTGGAGENSSGDMFLAFATGNRDAAQEGEPATVGVRMLPDERIDALFYAVIDAVEESILNAMLQAQTMTGRDGVTAHSLPPGRLVQVLREG